MKIVYKLDDTSKYLLFYYKLTFLNSQQEKTSSKVDFVGTQKLVSNVLLKNF